MPTGSPSLRPVVSASTAPSSEPTENTSTAVLFNASARPETTQWWIFCLLLLLCCLAFLLFYCRHRNRRKVVPLGGVAADVASLGVTDTVKHTTGVLALAAEVVHQESSHACSDPAQCAQNSPSALVPDTHFAPSETNKASIEGLPGAAATLRDTPFEQKEFLFAAEGAHSAYSRDSPLGVATNTDRKSDGAGGQAWGLFASQLAPTLRSGGVAQHLPSMPARPLPALNPALLFTAARRRAASTISSSAGIEIGAQLIAPNQTTSSDSQHSRHFRANASLPTESLPSATLQDATYLGERSQQQPLEMVGALSQQQLETSVESTQLKASHSEEASSFVATDAECFGTSTTSAYALLGAHSGISPLSANLLEGTVGYNSSNSAAAFESDSAVTRSSLFASESAQPEQVEQAAVAILQANVLTNESRLQLLEEVVSLVHQESIDAAFNGNQTVEQSTALARQSAGSDQGVTDTITEIPSEISREMVALHSQVLQSSAPATAKIPVTPSIPSKPPAQSLDADGVARIRSLYAIKVHSVIRAHRCDELGCHV